MPKKREVNSAKCSEFVRLIMENIFGVMRLIYSVDCRYLYWILKVFAIFVEILSIPNHYGKFLFLPISFRAG